MTTSDVSFLEMETKVVQLSDANKFALLESSRLPEAETLVAGLRELSPELAANFKFKRDTLADLVLRMLCSVDADVVQNSAATVPSYLAVSYCWHNSSWTAVEAAQPLTEWGVSLPMANKILDLRESKNEGVWVDAVCIDQQNHAEKRTAIGAMDVVYRSCRRLVMVLEDIQLTQAEDDIGLKYAQLYQSMCRIVGEKQLEGAKKDDFIASYWQVDEPDVATLVQFAMKMLGARWFSRAWCAQEARVNKHARINNPLFLCFGVDGRVLSFEFRYIHWLSYSLNMLQMADANGALPSVTNDPSFLSDPSCPTLLQRMARIHTLAADSGGRRTSYTSLISILANVSIFDCQEISDLFAIALNTAQVPLVYHGAIESQDDIHYLASVMTLASGDINPLITASSPLKLSDTSGNQFISWATQPLHGPGEIRLGTPFRKSISRVTVEYIELDLLVFDGKPLRISTECLQKASSILEKIVPRRQTPTGGTKVRLLSERIVKSAIQIMNDINLDLPLTQSILGSAIECGIDWIRRFPDVLEKEARLGAWDSGTFDGFNPDFTDAATELLSHFGITRETSPEFDTVYLHPTIRFFTYMTDERLLLVLQDPRRIPTKASGDFALTNRASHRSWFAVPQAAAYLPFFYDKAWVVEPHDPANPLVPEHERLLNTHAARGAPADSDAAWADSHPLLDSDWPDRRSPANELQSWRLRGKQKLVGCQPLIVDGEAVFLLKNQKVYGREGYDWGAMLRKLGYISTSA